jgi:DUF971 family protein
MATLLSAESPSAESRRQKPEQPGAKSGKGGIDVAFLFMETFLSKEESSDE